MLKKRGIQRIGEKRARKVRTEAKCRKRGVGRAVKNGQMQANEEEKRKSNLYVSNLVGEKREWKWRWRGRGEKGGATG